MSTIVLYSKDGKVQKIKGAVVRGCYNKDHKPSIKIINETWPQGKFFVLADYTSIVTRG